jgi:hypothetical protein
MIVLQDSASAKQCAPMRGLPEENLMRDVLRPVVAALCFGGLVATVSAGAAFAQSAAPTPAVKPAASAPAAAPVPEMPALKQIALTDKQIESVLAAQKDIDAVTSKLPEDAAAKPDPKVMTQLDEAAKKNGFADFRNYNDVIENISLVMSGFDPKTKAYVGPEIMIKQQIAAVQADTKVPAKDKTEILAELNGALKSPPPAIENKSNIDVVGKYYDKLFAAMQGDE